MLLDACDGVGCSAIGPVICMSLRRWEMKVSYSLQIPYLCIKHGLFAENSANCVHPPQYQVFNSRGRLKMDTSSSRTAASLNDSL